MGDESNNNGSPLPQTDVQENETLNQERSFDDEIYEGEESCQQTQISAPYSPSQTQVTQEQRPDTEMGDINFDEMCEMVMAYRCKRCSFLFQDKPTLITHIKHRHFGGNSGSGIKRHKSSNQSHVLEDIDNAVFDFSKIKSMFK
jgi:hypothetical protein